MYDVFNQSPHIITLIMDKQTFVMRILEEYVDRFLKDYRGMSLYRIDPKESAFDKQYDKLTPLVLDTVSTIAEQEQDIILERILHIAHSLGTITSCCGGSTLSFFYDTYSAEGDDLATLSLEVYKDANYEGAYIFTVKYCSGNSYVSSTSVSIVLDNKTLFDPNKVRRLKEFVKFCEKSQSL